MLRPLTSPLPRHRATPTSGQTAASRLGPILTVALTLAGCGGDLGGSAMTADELAAGRSGSSPEAGSSTGGAGVASASGAGNPQDALGGAAPALGSPADNNAGAGAGAESSGGQTDAAGGAGAPADPPDAGTQAAGGPGDEPPEDGGTPTTEPEEPRIRFVGRMDERDPAGPRFAWSGSGLVAAFSGTRVSVTLDDASENQFTVLVDGELQDKLIATAGATEYVLAEGLAPGEHVLELYRRTEALFGVTQFLGLDFGADGELLPPPPAPERRLEIIGDSISCGYGNEGTSASCGFSADTENHYATYGAIAARMSGAELTTIAWSGKGVVYNYGEDKQDPLPALYSRTLPEDPTSSYDFAVAADAVVINLGTNDFSTDDDPFGAVFQNAYAQLLSDVRAAYPEALLLCTVAPLLTGQDLLDAQADINAVIAERVAEGDERVFAWEVVIANDNPGCDYHPSLPTHELLAVALLEELSLRLGW